MAICARACNEITQELEYSPGPVKAESRSGMGPGGADTQSKALRSCANTKTNSEKGESSSRSGP